MEGPADRCACGRSLVATTPSDILRHVLGKQLDNQSLGAFATTSRVAKVETQVEMGKRKQESGIIKELMVFDTASWMDGVHFGPGPLSENENETTMLSFDGFRMNSLHINPDGTFEIMAACKEERDDGTMGEITDVHLHFHNGLLRGYYDFQRTRHPVQLRLKECTRYNRWP